MIFSPLALIALSQFLATVVSVTICNGTLTSPNPIKDNVLVTGSCKLAVDVDGNVDVLSGGDLTTSGKVLITGKVTAKGLSIFIDIGNREDYSVTLPSVRKINITIVGGLDVRGMDFVTIRPDVSVGPISVGNVKTLTHRGVAKSITTKDFSFVSTRGGTVEGIVVGLDGSSSI